MSAEERIHRCDDPDECRRKGKSVISYEIRWDGAVFEADLCKEHSAPLREFMARFPDHFTVKLPAGAKRGIQIHTMDEIEAMKDGKPRRG